MPGDVRRAFVSAWLIISCLAGAAVLAPFLASAETLHSVFPVCAAKQADSSCIACGLTTGFIATAHGQWE
jgi:hypothetical protein